jgi:hypothetical protein
VAKENIRPPEDREIFRQFLTNQRLEIENQQRENEVRALELQGNAEYAKNLVNAQYDIAKNKPKQDRYSALVFAGIIAFFVILGCAFLIYLLRTDEKELANTLLTWGGRLVALSLSFLFGRLSVKKSKDDASTNSNAEIVN